MKHLDNNSGLSCVDLPDSDTMTYCYSEQREWNTDTTLDTTVTLASA